MTVILNNYPGNGFQRWLDGLGIAQSLKSKYWTTLKAKVDAAADFIIKYQQDKFKKAILRESDGQIMVQSDGTYGTRGYNSRDCFTSLQTKVNGRSVIIGHSHEKRTAGDTAPAPGIHTCSAKALEPLGTKAAIKSVFQPKNGLKLIAVNGDGDAQE